MNKPLSSQLTPRQKRASTLCVGFSLMAAGIFLLLLAVGAIDIELKRAVLPTLILGLGAALLTSSFPQNNILWMWLGWLTVTCGVATFLGEFLDCGYGGVYFVYILSPAVASFFTMLKSRDYGINIKIIALFSTAGLIALLSARFDRAVVLSAGLIALSLAIIVSAFFKENKGK